MFLARLLEPFVRIWMERGNELRPAWLQRRLYPRSHWCHGEFWYRHLRPLGKPPHLILLDDWRCDCGWAYTSTPS